jgi:hypothetical protein
MLFKGYCINKEIPILLTIAIYQECKPKKYFTFKSQKIIKGYSNFYRFMTELEINQLVERKYNSIERCAFYELTDYGRILAIIYKNRSDIPNHLKNIKIKFYYKFDL